VSGVASDEPYDPHLLTGIEFSREPVQRRPVRIDQQEAGALR
jgi:hypothetical protein